MSVFQFRGLCLCFIYFCLCFCSLQNFLQFLDAQRFFPALQLSLCQKSPWHRGSLTPTGPYFYESKKWDKTEWDTSFLTAGSTWERDCWHTSCTAGGADTGSELPNHTGAGVSCMQIHPIILHSKAMASLFEFTFFTIYKYLFSFPHKICMTGPARACILQVKPG